MSSRVPLLQTMAGCLVLLATAVQGRALYVSGSGSDSRSGQDSSNAFRTLQRAASLTSPGDTVYCMNGSFDAFRISRSGSSSAWIVYTARKGHNPRVTGLSWSAIEIQASYIEVSGLEIVGRNSSLGMSLCDQGETRYGSGECNCAGIASDGRGGNHPHHIRIVGNKVHDLPGGGISVIQSDYVTIEHNEVYNTAWFTQYAMSGISTWQNWRFDESTGYKMIIRGNKVYGNKTQVKWSAIGDMSDGNGIIIDDSKNTQNASTLGRYTGRTLVANNICFNNGGSGIHAYMSEHVDIVNNTTYHNGQVVGYANCFAGSCSDVYLLNNIACASPGKPVNSNHNNTNVTYDYNIYFGGNAPAIKGPHDIVADPKFVSPSTNPALADFHLQPSSPAIDRGTATKAPAVDYAGIARPQGGKVDIGAYETGLLTPVNRARTGFGQGRTGGAGSFGGASGILLDGRAVLLPRLGSGAHVYKCAMAPVMAISVISPPGLVRRR